MEIINYSTEYNNSLIIFVQKVFKENGIKLNLNNAHIDFTHPEKYYCNFIILVDSEDNVCGCLGLRILDSKRKIAEIKRLYLLSNYHNLGYGKSMLDIMILKAKKLNIRYLRLDTKERYKKAINLIESRNFYRIERYNNSNATLFYEKSL